jgi:hypothetical protein
VGAVIVSVQVYRSAIARDYQVGGQGYRWLDKVKLAMHTLAVQKASGFVRSGEILRGHRSEILGINQYSCYATIYNVAEHSEWVHGGTTGPIYPEEGVWLYLPPGNGFRKKRLRSVAGQKANPWLEEACSAVAMGYGAIPIG